MVAGVFVSVRQGSVRRICRDVVQLRTGKAQMMGASKAELS
jgi:ABC-type polysaccharide/polyol phosphate transport system ATPase subunit